MSGAAALHQDRGFLQPANFQILLRNIFRFNQTITVQSAPSRAYCHAILPHRRNLWTPRTMPPLSNGCEAPAFWPQIRNAGKVARI